MNIRVLFGAFACIIAIWCFNLELYALIYGVLVGWIGTDLQRSKQ